MQETKYHNKIDLVHAFSLGREDAFEEIFQALYSALCYYGFKITGDFTASEDIAAESFMKVWNRRQDFHHFLSLKSFLYTTVRNASIDWGKKSNYQAKSLLQAQPSLQHSTATRLEQLITAETYRELHAAIEELPAQCGKVMSMYYLEGKKLKQIAAELNIEIGSIKSHKSRGVLLLRKRLRYFLQMFL